MSAPPPAAGGSPRDVFEETALPFLPDCLAFALSLTKNRHDAEDLVQDVYLKAQRAFGTFTPGTHAKAWLFTILRRLHIDHFRRRRIRPTVLPGDDLEEMQSTGEGPERLADLPWDRLEPGAVWDAVEALPEPFRLAVRLRDLDGFSYKEIGEILDVPLGTVMSRLHRGREYIRRTLVSKVDPRTGTAE
ncbi:MAG: sigma-70 family RNA polymerase sigma factor [Planctomycetota bacterium]